MLFAYSVPIIFPFDQPSTTLMLLLLRERNVAQKVNLIQKRLRKVKTNLSPQLINRKKKKLDRALLKHERRSERILKPIEENEVSVPLKRDIRAGTREREKMVYMSDELESHILLEKDWARYKIKQHHNELKACARMRAAQEKALEKLREESEELYQAAVMCDDRLFPYTFKGPLNTPPKTGYYPADGNYIDRTNYFEDDTGLFEDTDILEKKKKKGRR